MPEKQTVERARKAKREGKAPATQASEFVKEEMHHVREGSHAASGAALSKQTKAAARRRTAADRSAAAHKAVRTKGHAGLSRAAHKAARTRAART